MNSEPLYRRIKWVWLLSRCALPTLAMLYLLEFTGSDFSGDEPRVFGLPASVVVFLLTVSGGLYLVLWLIAESLLSMYRFPLELRDAVLLLAGFLVQIVVLTLTGDSLSFAAYVSMVVTLVALFVCFSAMALLFLVESLPGMARRSMRRCLGITAATVAGIAVAGLSLACLVWPSLAGFGDMRGLYQALNAGILLANVASTVRALRDLSIWGKPDPLRARYDEAWKQWAAPTIGLLILAVTAAVMTGGIMWAV